MSENPSLSGEETLDFSSAGRPSPVLDASYGFLAISHYVPFRNWFSITDRIQILCINLQDLRHLTPLICHKAIDYFTALKLLRSKVMEFYCLSGRCAEMKGGDMGHLFAGIRQFLPQQNYPLVGANKTQSRPLRRASCLLRKIFKIQFRLVLW